MEIKRDCSADAGYDFSFDPYSASGNIPVSQVIDNFNGYNRSYVNDFDRNVSKSRFVVLGCDPRFDRILLGETQWSPLQYDSGQYTQTVRITEIIDGSIVSSAENTVDFAAYFGNAVIPDTLSISSSVDSSFWYGPLNSGSEATAIDGFKRTHAESGRAAFDAYYSTVTNWAYGVASPNERSVPVGGSYYGGYVNYTVENFTDTQARPVPSMLALSANMFDINTKKGMLTISGASLFGLMGAYGPLGGVVLDMNQNAWTPGYVSSGEFRTARLTNADLGATISNHSLAGTRFSTKETALSAQSGAPVVGRAWLSSPIYIPTWEVPK